MKVLPLSPDDPIPDLEESLAALQALGPAEFDAGERECMVEMLGEMDRLGRDAWYHRRQRGRLCWLT